MKTFLLSACAAAVIATTASTAFAGQFTTIDNGPSGAIIRVDDNGNYNYNQNYRWPNQTPGYGNQDRDWDGDRDRDWRDNDRRWDDRDRNDGRYGWGNHGILPPRVIVRYLDRNNFRYISQPMLAGRIYQVKAINPRGQKVKLYIDAYNGHVVKVKYR